MKAPFRGFFLHFILFQSEYQEEEEEFKFYSPQSLFGAPYPN